MVIDNMVRSMTSFGTASDTCKPTVHSGPAGDHSTEFSGRKHVFVHVHGCEGKQCAHKLPTFAQIHRHCNAKGQNEQFDRPSGKASLSGVAHI